MKRFLIFLFICIIAAPFTLYAKDAKDKKPAAKHIQTPDYQECSECHVPEKQLWDEGKHGLMNVKCVVCHGSTDKNFHPKPDIYRCVGCHAGKVADVEKKLLPKERKCALCHTLHSVKSKFHSEGGN